MHLDLIPEELDELDRVRADGQILVEYTPDEVAVIIVAREQSVDVVQLVAAHDGLDEDQEAPVNAMRSTKQRTTDVSTLKDFTMFSIVATRSIRKRVRIS